MGASYASDAAAGATAYKGKDPIGGGSGYTRYAAASEAAYVVATIAELKDALGRARAGEVVYVADGAEIDATGERNIVIPGGVTLAGSRGKDGAPGPLIRATKLELHASTAPAEVLASWDLFVTGGPKARVTGLRIQGPDTTIRKEAYEAPNCDGIRCTYPDLEVDNCELWGWSHAGIFLSGAGKGAHIHNCYIHHCRRNGLGYGICLHESQALIECNHFVDNRHDIAGTGRAGTSYLARYNISEAVDPPIGHAFDMHGNHESRPPGEWPKFAGDSIVICCNTFKSNAPRDYITIRGNPRLGGTIHDNVYQNARYGARGWEACASLVIYGDVLLAKPQYGYYRFETPGNIVNGKRLPKGIVTQMP